MEFDKLVKHMSSDSRNVLEKSVALASSRSHFSIEIEHWLFELLQSEDKDVNVILSHFGIEYDKLFTDISNKIELIKTGNDGFPKISQEITRLLFESWMIASSEYSSLEISACHILLAAVDNPHLRLKVLKISSEFEKLSAEDIREQCETLLKKTANTGAPASDDSQSGQVTKTPALNQFAINMTEQARAGKIDKVLGRDNEIRQMIDILCRRKQNNPILTGEAGVGKTAVVEGLAERIASGDVPNILKGTELYSLDMGLLQAGAGVKGEFENRLKNVIKEVQNSSTPIVMFIDEAHTMIGAGNQAGAGDAANLLKPALARGELRTIAATTWAEYKKYFETDAALTRRFQVVKIEEPTEAQAITMLRSVAPTLEKHHEITILDEAISSAVTLSHRYIAGRQLPDKCVSLLDTACARVNLSLSTKPDAIEAYEREIENIEFEMSRLSSEVSAGIDHSEQLAELEINKASAEAAQSEVQEQWSKEQELIQRIVEYRKELETLKNDENSDDKKAQKEIEKTIKSLRKDREALAALQGSKPLMYECVDAQVVAEVVADWTGIPVGRMQTDEIDNIMALQSHMEARVVGQSHGLEKIAQTMQTARAKLSDPRRPLGVFMLVGPSGVGKTETALALAEQLYGSDQNITVINMSEFKEEHKVSLLMGSPPGYVGYGEGGVLTEAVRRKPYSVVLLDEVEKAHPGVQDIFYQVFDKGMLRDGEGRDIDFKNTVIIMTSNTASDQIEQLCADPDTKPLPDNLVEAIGPTLRETYKPAFLGRINIIPYYPLEQDILGQIANMQLETIKQRIQNNYQVELTYSKKLISHIVEQCQQSDAGARQISLLLNNTLLPQMAQSILSALSSEKEFDQVSVDIDKNNQFDIKLKTKRQKAAAKSKAKAKEVA
jgi:type VI secretion system protein VasG